MNTENTFSHLIHKETGRYLCDAENPMPNSPPSTTRWVHPDAKEVREDYGKGGGVADGDFVKYKCPNCGKEWWEELPN